MFKPTRLAKDMLWSMNEHLRSWLLIVCHPQSYQHINATMLINNNDQQQFSVSSSVRCCPPTVSASAGQLWLWLRLSAILSHQPVRRTGGEAVLCGRTSAAPAHGLDHDSSQGSGFGELGWAGSGHCAGLQQFVLSQFYYYS